jgi:hypothetical protein
MSGQAGNNVSEQLEERRAEGKPRRKELFVKYLLLITCDVFVERKTLSGH